MKSHSSMYQARAMPWKFTIGKTEPKEWDLPSKSSESDKFQMLYKANNSLSCAHRLLLRESLPRGIYYGQGTEGRGNYDVGELSCPCTQHKVLVTESVWQEKPMTKQVFTTQGDSSCLQNKWTKLFFSCAFAHSASTTLTLAKPSTQFPKSKLPSVLDFQLLLSLHFCSVSRCSSCTGRAQPSGPHGLIFYTHTPTPKNPLGHMIHHLFKPCHVPVFLCSSSYWCKSLVPQELSIAFFTEGKVAVTLANLWDI